MCAAIPRTASSPTLVDFQASPSTVDTSQAEQLIRYSAHLTDSADQLSNRLIVTATNRRTSKWFWSEGFRQSGDGHDGVYGGLIDLPHYAAQGNWDLTVAVSSNTSSMAWCPGDLQALGFTSTIEQVGPGDDTPPQISNVSFSRTSVDASSSDRAVAVSAHVTDDFGMGPQFNSGGVENQRVYVELVDPSDGVQSSAPLELTSGTTKDGIWQGTLTVPSGAPPGQWQFDIAAWDEARNVTAMNGQDLVQHGYEGYLQVTN